jgi:hypothetical protein
MIHLDTSYPLSVSTFLDLVDDLTPLQGNALVAARIVIVYGNIPICLWLGGKSSHTSGRIYSCYKGPATHIQLVFCADICMPTQILNSCFTKFRATNLV